MGHREVRPVAIGWEHPRLPGTYSNGKPRYRGLFSREDLRWRLEWNAAHPDDEDAAEDIDLDEYMPEIPEGEPFAWVLYETTSEGSPVSPPFATLEELADWCEGNATVFGPLRWTRDEWLASFNAGTTGTDSLMIAGSGGVTTLNRLAPDTEG
jgi:hypothetical protein